MQFALIELSVDKRSSMVVVRSPLYQFELFLTVIQALMREEVQGSNLEEPSLHVYMSLTGNSVMLVAQVLRWKVFIDGLIAIDRKE